MTSVCFRRREVVFGCWLLVFALVAPAMEPMTADRDRAECCSPGDFVQNDLEVLERSLLQMPSEQVFRIWKDAKQHPEYVHEFVIVHVSNLAPYFISIIRNREEKMFDRWRAIRVMCDGDRFVPRSELILPELEGAGLIGLHAHKGRVNRFAPVTGRRIGQDAFDALSWASQQTAERELRFHARESMGKLDEDLRPLSLKEKIQRWAAAIVRNKGNLGGMSSPDQYLVGQKLADQLIDAAPESLPLLADLLKSDGNAFVREATVALFQEIDARRLRLRSSQQGRDAITAVRLALREGKFAPVYQSKRHRTEWWAALSRQFFDDDSRSLASNLNTLLDAGERLSAGTAAQRPARPTHKDAGVVRGFLAYLTKTDPGFPSWEYSFRLDAVNDQMLHPRFKVKVDRVREAWGHYSKRLPEPR